MKAVSFLVASLLAAVVEVSSEPFVYFKRDVNSFNKRDTSANYKCVPVNIPSKLRFLHTNDIHSRLDQFDNKYGSDCSANSMTRCVGGAARIIQTINDIRANSSNTVLFDAGDQFQGTLFYTVFKGAKSAEFMNAAQYDLMCIGNHEFDGGVPNAGAFFKKLNFAVVSSNFDATKEAAKPLVEAGVQPYKIFEKYNMAVIGYITKTAGDITNSPGMSFSDPIVTVQKYIDELHAKGIKRIVCVSHNGYMEDKELAEKTSGINLIIGGHSHSLLLKNLTLPGVEGAYPSKVVNLANETTVVVTAHRWGDYLGNIEVEWDSQDHLLSVIGEPIFLNQAMPVDPSFAAKVANWSQEFIPYKTTILGELKNSLENVGCWKQECAIGDLVADAMLEHVSTQGVNAAFINTGGIRASFRAGNISAADILAISPFGNVISTFDYTGKELLLLIQRHIMALNVSAVENGAAGPADIFLNGDKNMISPPQWAGIKFTYDLTAPAYQKVFDAVISDTKGSYVTIDPIVTYRLATLDFISTGGDYIIPPLDRIKNKIVVGDVFADTIGEYFTKHTPVTGTTDGRWSPRV